MIFIPTACFILGIPEDFFPVYFFKNPAEISLVMVAAHFSNLFNGQPRFVEQKSLGVAHSKVDQIPGRCTVVDLAEILVR